MSLSLQEFCERNNIDENHAIILSLTSGDGGKFLPTPDWGFVGYFAEITDTALICSDKNQTMSVTIPFAAFSRAEFGIGGGNLWLQCIVDGDPFTFAMPRRNWKSEAAKLLMQRIEAVTPLIDKKEYDHYTGKLFFIYMLK